MSDDHEELVKIRQKVEDLEAEARDRWHENRPSYVARVERGISNSKFGAVIFLAIDGVKSVTEIIQELHIPQKSAWRAFESLRREGLLKPVKAIRGSPVYAKRPWVKELGIDEYVREKFHIVEPGEPQS